MKGIYFAYAIIWIAVSAAVIIGLYLTRNIHCLWFLVIPLFVSMKHDSKDEASKEREGGVKNG